MAQPKIFVSHSSDDTAFAMSLVADLCAAGAHAWLDTNDLGAGNFQERISTALAECEWFVLVLTRNALASRWVTAGNGCCQPSAQRKRDQEPDLREGRPCHQPRIAGTLARIQQI